jgi:hypothetical protein
MLCRVRTQVLVIGEHMLACLAPLSMSHLLVLLAGAVAGTGERERERERERGSSRASGLVEACI